MHTPSHSPHDVAQGAIHDPVGVARWTVSQQSVNHAEGLGSNTIGTMLFYKDSLNIGVEFRNK